jgi:hypothetical protein
MLSFSPDTLSAYRHWNSIQDSGLGHLRAIKRERHNTDRVLLLARSFQPLPVFFAVWIKPLLFIFFFKNHWHSWVNIPDYPIGLSVKRKMGWVQ